MPSSSSKGSSRSSVTKSVRSRGSKSNNNRTPRSSSSTWTENSTLSFMKRPKCPSKMQLVIVAFERALDLLRNDVDEMKTSLKAILNQL